MNEVGDDVRRIRQEHEPHDKPDDLRYHARFFGGGSREHRCGNGWNRGEKEIPRQETERE
jgi:hypothetical protein